MEFRDFGVILKLSLSLEIPRGPRTGSSRGPCMARLSTEPVLVIHYGWVATHRQTSSVIRIQMGREYVHFIRMYRVPSKHDWLYNKWSSVKWGCWGRRMPTLHSYSHWRSLITIHDKLRPLQDDNPSLAPPSRSTQTPWWHPKTHLKAQEPYPWWKVP